MSAMNLLKQDFPQIICQPPSLIQSTGFDYCPFETIQIVNNEANHWILLTSIKGQITIYDSLNTNPTQSVLNQMTQLFSPDSSVPPFTQPECVKQIGSTDCGIFTIAYAIDVLNGLDPKNVTYDQTKMRDHLIQCFENKQLTSFPKYNLKQTNNIISRNTTLTDWKSPRRSQRIKNRCQIKLPNIKLQNQFEILGEIQHQNNNKNIKETPTTQQDKCKHQITNIIHNISGFLLNHEEISVLEKGLNFCPTTKDLNQEELLDDLFSFCRKQRLKHHFHNNETSINNKNDLQEERCELKSVTKNPYFNPPTDTCPKLESYLSCIKTDITNLLNQPQKTKTNLTVEERLALQNLSSNSNLIIKKADKGGKIVIMERELYINNCEKQLNDTEFYEKITNDPTKNYCEHLQNEFQDMKTKELITEKEYKYLTEHLENPRLSIFYGLPKIHKLFQTFPPLRPIVSNYNSCTSRLSEYLDTFLKYQAQRSKSYIRDTKYFLNKIRKLKNLPANTILVTMDVASLYTNIDHQEGADICFQHLENRTSKTIPSTLLKKLILFVLRSNIFRFGINIYRQIKGTARGTPMAANYANLFMTTLEEKIINEFHEKTRLKPFIYFRFIDDIFFIWTHGEKSLQEFIKFANEYTDKHKMKSKIKFETNISSDKVSFLDVEISIHNGKLKTSLYSKPTDAHLYLNAFSCHPSHTIRNIPKGQFIRIRRICSDTNDFLKHSKHMMDQFVKRGFSLKILQKTLEEILKIDREELLSETKPKTKDQQSIFICTWHPKLKNISSIFRKHFNIIEQDHQLRKVFTTPPFIAFRRKKNIANHITKNDINAKKNNPCITTCNKCQICHLLNKTNLIQNENVNISVKLKSTGNCKTRNIIYAAKCKKHKIIYTGHTSEQLNTRFSKHKYDIKNRPDNSELAEHFNKNHDINKDLEIYILETDIPNHQRRILLEDRWMCKLQTLQPTGMNKDGGSYLKEMYPSWTSSLTSNCDVTSKRL